MTSQAVSSGSARANKLNFLGTPACWTKKYFFAFIKVTVQTGVAKPPHDWPLFHSKAQWNETLGPAVLYSWGDKVLNKA